MFELYFLLGFMIIGAIIAVELEDLLSSVIAVGAVGLGLSMAFLILKAPDLAITQLVVEILCLIILIRATIKKDLPFSTSGRWFLNTFITIAFVMVFIMVALKAFIDLPEFGFPLMRISQTYIAEAIAKTGATNVVSAIILDFRGYDTLGEATILFTAVIGVWTIMRRTGRKKANSEGEEDV